MVDILEGPRASKGLPRDDANAPRIGRARFLGHGVGLFLIYLVVAMVLGFVGLGASSRYHAIFVLAQWGPADVNVTVSNGLNLWAGLVLNVLFAVAWADLVVRRRHDRNRSGVDGVGWMFLLLVSQALHAFELAPYLVGWRDAALIVGWFYLFVVLALLPGTRGPNRYGDPVQPPQDA